MQNYTVKEFLRYKICLLLIFLLFFILALISFYPNVLTFSCCTEIEQNSRMKDESKPEKFVIFVIHDFSSNKNPCITIKLLKTKK